MLLQAGYLIIPKIVRLLPGANVLSCVSPTKYLNFSVIVVYREYIQYLITSILLTDKNPVTVFETVA